VELNELERQILLHRRSRQKEVLVLAAVAALLIAGIAVIALVLARVF
jgi:hypothetical protein